MTTQQPNFKEFIQEAAKLYKLAPVVLASERFLKAADRIADDLVSLSDVARNSHLTHIDEYYAARDALEAFHTNQQN